MAKKAHIPQKRGEPVYYFRAWRKYRGLTQEQLAERVEMSVSSISQIETGQQGFTDSTLQALAHALQCEPGDLLSRDPRAEGTIVDLLRLIDEKKAKDTVMAFLKALP